jgi:hypothetical protein
MLSVAWVIDCRLVAFQVEFLFRDRGEGGNDTDTSVFRHVDVCYSSPDSKYHSTLVSRYVSRHVCVCGDCFKVCLSGLFTMSVYVSGHGMFHDMFVDHSSG